MIVEADKQDEKIKEAIDAEIKEKAKLSQFKRLIDYNTPKINIAFGVFSAMIQGSLMPIFGILLTKTLFALLVAQIPLVLRDLIDWKTELREGVDKWCLYMFIAALVALVVSYCRFLSFAVIGENVTARIRRETYGKILEKHQGWFDDKENAPGTLTNVLGSEAQIINGASSEGLAMGMETTFALLVGIAIGFAYSWRESLVALACVPFQMLGGLMNVRIQKGLNDDNERTS